MRALIAIFTILLLSPLIAATTIAKPDDALHLDWIDPNISPTENFFAYANGRWQKQNPIPPEYASWGSFHILDEKVQNTIHQMLIEAAEKKAAPGSIEQKVGDFYFSGMNEQAINQLGIEPLKPEFANIDSIKNLADLQRVITHLQMIGVDALFGFGSMQDFKNSKEMIGAAVQSGLGLPDRDYYFKKDKKFQQIRAAYVQHIGKMFELLGDSPDKASVEAATVMKIETTLANASMTQTEQRDPHAIYHIMTVDEIQSLTPNFIWSKYFTALNHPEIKSINLAMPAFFKAMNETLQKVPLEDWKTYLRWHLIDSFCLVFIYSFC